MLVLLLRVLRSPPFPAGDAGLLAVERALAGVKRDVVPTFPGAGGVRVWGGLDGDAAGGCETAAWVVGEVVRLWGDEAAVRLSREGEARRLWCEGEPVWL